MRIVFHAQNTTLKDYLSQVDTYYCKMILLNLRVPRHPVAAVSEPRRLRSGHIGKAALLSLGGSGKNLFGNENRQRRAGDHGNGNGVGRTGVDFYQFFSLSDTELRKIGLFFNA